jgi:hypothetical protein
VQGLELTRFNGYAIELASAGNDTVAANFIGTDRAGNTHEGNGNGVVILGTSNNTIGGSGQTNRIAGNSGAGVYIIGSSASNNKVIANNIGLNYSGTAPLGNTDGVAISGGVNNTLGWNIISASSYVGVEMWGGASGNILEGNAIGTNWNGKAGLGNATGVSIHGASNNTIGMPGAANTISGNAGDGVYIGDFNGQSSYNVVQSNFIGTDATGTFALPNFNGIDLVANTLANGVYHNTIGGTTTATRNIISANSNAGIQITGFMLPNTWFTATFTTIENNYIGTDVNGNCALGNAYGIIISGGAYTAIGGSSPSVNQNVISANRFDGVLIEGGAMFNALMSNDIGTNALGTSALGNGTGVHVTNASYTLIGQYAAVGPLGNVISGNSGAGIILGSGATNTNVFENIIGAQGNNVGALANLGDGILLQSGASNNVIGAFDAGTGLSEGNFIRFNGGWGVEDRSGMANTIDRVDNVVSGNTLGSYGP